MKNNIVYHQITAIIIFVAITYNY